MGPHPVPSVNPSSGSGMHGPEAPSDSYIQEHQGGYNHQSSFIGDLIPLAFLGAGHSASPFQSFLNHAPMMSAQADGNDSQQEGALDDGYYALHLTRLYLLMVCNGSVPTNQQVQEVLQNTLKTFRKS